MFVIYNKTVICSLPELIFQSFAHETSPSIPEKNVFNLHGPVSLQAVALLSRPELPYIASSSIIFTSNSTVCFSPFHICSLPTQGPLASFWNWHQNQGRQKQVAQSLWQAPTLSSVLFAHLLAAHQSSRSVPSSSAPGSHKHISVKQLTTCSTSTSWSVPLMQDPDFCAREDARIRKNWSVPLRP